VRFALGLLALAACSSGGAPAPAVSAPLDATVPDASASDGLDDATPAPDDAGVVDPAARLVEGRAFSQKQQWAKAIAALELAAAGGDVAALAELAFTATLAGDDRRAARAAQAVIDDPATDPPARATAYYHLGRAAELRGDLPAARAAYEQSVALRASTPVSARLADLGTTRRRGPPPPPSPPCNRPQPAVELCGCLGTALTLEGARCVISHNKHGGGAYAVTVVAREQAPTFLVTKLPTGQLQVLARLGVTSSSVPDAELTITRWNVLDGPAGAPLIRVDARMDQRDAAGKARPLREDAVLCVAGAAPRCLATLPLMEKVGTPSTVRHLALAIDASDDTGVVHVTVTDGPGNPATLLGSHQLW